MTNTEILLNAIEKAKDNGYPAPLERNLSLLMATYPLLIFSHDFAKSFWYGEESFQIGAESYRAWQYHLQQMILEEEPLKYLEKFLNV